MTLQALRLMLEVNNKHRPSRSILAIIVGLLTVCAGCAHNAKHSGQQELKHPVIVISPGNNAQNFDPTAPVAVASFGAQLTAVTVKSADGKEVKGDFSDDKRSWYPTESLNYNSKYQVVAQAEKSDNSPIESSSVFYTAEPDNKTRVYFRTSGGADLLPDTTYGVGLVISAHFDEPITNMALAEKYLSVKTTPAVTGSWYWLDNQNAHWRPKEFYPTGTAITVSANIYGQQLGDGLYGEKNTSVSVKIGPKHYARADDTTHMISVYDGDKLVRTMPTSMGVGGYLAGSNGIKVSLWTPPGIYTVIGRQNPVIMDSSTFGLPVNSRMGYKESINYATRISNDGIYLHQLNSTIWAQGSQDTSHGCLNLNYDNASWFYNWALDGDPVEVVHTGGPPLAIWQNGDWSVPWDKWLQGSALH